MTKDNLVALKKPELVKDLLTEVIRNGALQLLMAAVEGEVEEFLAEQQHYVDEGKPRFVRNGFLPEREIQTGIGAVAVKVPRVRDRSDEKDGIGFSSSIIPKYLRRSTNMNEFLPLLYLKGISSNDFSNIIHYGTYNMGFCTYYASILFIAVNIACVSFSKLLLLLIIPSY